jgi:hypothetical protein
MAENENQEEVQESAPESTARNLAVHRGRLPGYGRQQSARSGQYSRLAKQQAEMLRQRQQNPE